jgi:hypothetical protein
MAEEFVGDVGEAVDLAIAAAEQVAEELGGHVANRNFAGVDVDGVEESGIPNEGRVVKPQQAWRGDEARAAVAEAVDVLCGTDLGLDVERVRVDKVPVS